MVGLYSAHFQVCLVCLASTIFRLFLIAFHLPLVVFRRFFIRFCLSLEPEAHAARHSHEHVGYTQLQRNKVGVIQIIVVGDIEDPVVIDVHIHLLLHKLEPHGARNIPEKVDRQIPGGPQQLCRVIDKDGGTARADEQAAIGCIAGRKVDNGVVLGAVQRAAALIDRYRWIRPVGRQPLPANQFHT